MRGQFKALPAGGPWLHDWDAYETHYDWSGAEVSVGAESWHTFLDVAGEGWMGFARGNAGMVNSSNPDLRVTIDGVATIFNGMVGSHRQGNEVIFPLVFKESLKIEVYNRLTFTASFALQYTYFLKKRESDASLITILDPTRTRSMAYDVTASSAPEDILNISGSGYLTHVVFTGRSTSTNSRIIRGTVIVDGNTAVDNLDMLQVNTLDSVKRVFLIGPIRFENSLQVQHSLNTYGLAFAISRAWYLLDP